ncbi:potassium-transporting ATPase subunit C [Tessaracoccus aquimaris]|uniref:Potassium-transporting ATPase KdpC subunit n=1 Tax=Tessaracoccus aquimaris TaxID=1332264 RepID=A0A1Q2CJQ9_9ACTN|nr:potassium-transporting ATPase subunit KdpC [Tessaracoccus aquimaris]AQP46369.1 potassium-transporting ATPase subunit C [Tessaracoccus aquimaris]
MPQSLRLITRQSAVALRAMVLLTVVLGLVYPLALTGIGQVLFPWQANGSLVHDASGQVVGSKLIGQAFVDADGAPLPQYFQSRPSAAGDGYDGSASSGSNLGPNNPDLVAAIAERRAAVAEFNGVPESEVPADAVTASSSGLDPEISTAYAAIQVDRVAAARGIEPSRVADLVKENTSGIGYLSEVRVNVVELNLALDELEG